MEPSRSMRGRELLRLLQREPLGYELVRRTGSHLVLASRHGHPRLIFAFHDRQEIAPGLVRKVLSKDVGLTDDEIAALRW